MNNGGGEKAKPPFKEWQRIVIQITIILHKNVISSVTLREIYYLAPKIMHCAIIWMCSKRVCLYACVCVCVRDEHGKQLKWRNANFYARTHYHVHFHTHMRAIYMYVCVSMCSASSQCNKFKCEC